MKSPVPSVVIGLAVVLSIASSSVCPAVAAPGVGASVLDAARRRDIGSLRSLVRRGADVNVVEPDGTSALHWAAHWDDLPMAELLVKAGARVNQANDYGATPLWLASVHGGVPMVKALLQAGADSNAALYFGETPLMAASRSGAADVVRALLAKGARVDAQERQQGQTALMWAAAEGQVEVIRALLEGKASAAATTAGGFTPLMFVARQGSVDAARLLLDHGAAVNTESKAGATALLTAVVRGHVDVAELLLDRGAHPDLTHTGYTALHWAAGAWETSVTSDYEFTDIEWSALRGVPSPDDKVRIIRALVAHGAAVNAKTENEPLRTGYTLVTAMPLPLRKGTTPFYLAAMAGDAVVMRVLAELGADPTIRSANNTTPLMIAAGRVRVDHETRIREEDALAAVKVALELGNDIHAVNDEGETALHAAAIGGLNSVVEYLVAQGASLTALMKDGRTPFAVADGGYSYATLLVKRPATAALLRKLANQ